MHKRSEQTKSDDFYFVIIFFLVQFCRPVTFRYLFSRQELALNCTETLAFNPNANHINYLGNRLINVN